MDRNRQRNKDEFTEVLIVRSKARGKQIIYPIERKKSEDTKLVTHVQILTTQWKKKESELDSDDEEAPILTECCTSSEFKVNKDDMAMFTKDEIKVYNDSDRMDKTGMNVRLTITGLKFRSCISAN